MNRYDQQNLSKEELELDELFTWSDSVWLSQKELEKEKKRFMNYKVTKNDKKDVNLRLSASDIAKIKLKAKSLGITYNTLMSMKMHEFAND